MDDDNSLLGKIFGLNSESNPKPIDDFNYYFRPWAKRILQEPEHRELFSAMRQIMDEESEWDPNRDETENLAVFIYRRFSEVHPRAFGRFLRGQSVTVEMLRERMNPPPPTGKGYWWESPGGGATT